MTERGMRAERALQQSQAEKENTAHEQEKANAKAMKKKERDAQKREQSKTNRPSKGQGAFGNQFNIQQPKKSN